MGGPKGKGYKRSWKNLLLNKRYQLRFTLFMVIMSGVLMAALGWWVMSAAGESTSIGVDALRDSRDCVPPPKAFQDMQPVKSGIDLDSNDLDHSKKQKEPGAGADDVKVAKVDKVKVDAVKVAKVDKVKVDEVKVDEVKVDAVKVDAVKVDEVKVAKVDEVKVDEVKVAEVKVAEVKVAEVKVAEVKVADDDKPGDDKPGDDKPGDPGDDGDKPGADGEGDDDDDDDGDISDDAAYRKWKNSKKTRDFKVVLDVKVHPQFADKALEYYICQLKQVRAIGKVRRGQEAIFWVLIAVGLLLAMGLSVYGIKMTHKVAGPLHKVSLYFAKMRDENYDKVWNLRKGDQLVEFYDHFKAGHEGVCEMQRGDIEQLKVIIDAADKHDLAAKSPELAASIDELREILKRKEASLEQ